MATQKGGEAQKCAVLCALAEGYSSNAECHGSNKFTKKLLVTTVIFGGKMKT